MKIKTESKMYSLLVVLSRHKSPSCTGASGPASEDKQVKPSSLYCLSYRVFLLILGHLADISEVIITRMYACQMTSEHGQTCALQDAWPSLSIDFGPSHREAQLCAEADYSRSHCSEICSICTHFCPSKAPVRRKSPV